MMRWRGIFESCRTLSERESALSSAVESAFGNFESCRILSEKESALSSAVESALEPLSLVVLCWRRNLLCHLLLLSVVESALESCSLYQFFYIYIRNC